MTFDGIWNYQWDGENRLISMNMTNIAGLNANAQSLETNRLRLDFAYDYLGRRVQKTVSVWNSTTNGFQTSTASSFVYDGWNLVVVLNSQSSVLQSFVWGNDFSGTMTKAGGVGGLLMASISGTNCFAGYDGNGNTTIIISAIDGSLAAHYEYSPFGEVIRATGPMARVNIFRFSTKFVDDETQLIYYGFRYYSPVQGRWVGRDPSPDQLLELYCFNHNAPTLAIDPNGKNPLLIAVAIGAIVGGVIGAIENPNHWLGFTEGATAGAIAPLVGALAVEGLAAVVGEGIIASSLGAASAGASASYMRSVFDNAAHAQSNPFILSNKQMAMMGAAGTLGLLGGALIGYSAAARGQDVDEQVLDATLAVAGEVGVGIAEAFNAGAEATADAGAAIFQQHVNELN